MNEIKREGILLEKTNLGFENEAVMNPAVIIQGNDIHLFYRAVRKGNYSSIGHCILSDPLTIKERNDKPILIPDQKYESQGIEDPRIVFLEGKYYLTYSVYDKINVLGAYATSLNLTSFQKQKIITPKITYRDYKHCVECCEIGDNYLFHYNILKAHGLGKELSQKLFVWDKNIMLFPKKINGQFAMIHRIHPGIQIAYFNSFDELNDDYWKDYILNLEKYILMNPLHNFESSHIGGGCPPIETAEGWIFIYHAVELTTHGYVYHATAALLDLEDPMKVISRLSEPLLSPTTEWEKQGVVNNVIFPTGAIEVEDKLYVYYGAADERIATFSLKTKDLLSEFKKSKNKAHV